MAVASGEDRLAGRNALSDAMSRAIDSPSSPMDQIVPPLSRWQIMSS